ncbi:hypothetical protein NIES4103_27450 [Nostoc sp. NIES-4103]|nr:hypothetical protein NIES4103_27450 [Nostoc sp. NIES-4103]
MPTHCNTGDKPVIKYRFQGDTKDRVFKTKFAPVTVDIKEQPINSGSYASEGMKINYIITDGDKPRSEIVLAYRVDYYNFFGGYWGLLTIPCGATKQNFPANPTDTGRGVAIYPNSIVVDTSVKCPVAANKRCSIEIKHKGIIIFQDQGNCPVTYSFQCGNCPDSQHECESKIYPYYCCNSCADTANKIRNLASKIGKS